MQTLLMVPVRIRLSSGYDYFQTFDGVVGASYSSVHKNGSFTSYPLLGLEILSLLTWQARAFKARLLSLLLQTCYLASALS